MLCLIPLYVFQQDAFSIPLFQFQWSVNVAKITEVAPVALLPNMVVQKKVLKPFR